MTSASQPKSRVKVREHRERLRRQGLRPIQIWVPDVRAPAFRCGSASPVARRGCSAHAHADQAFIDEVSDRGDE